IIFLCVLCVSVVNNLHFSIGAKRLSLRSSAVKNGVWGAYHLLDKIALKSINECVMKELKDLIRLLLKFKGKLITGLLFLLIVDVAQMVVPWVLKFVVDDLSTLPLSHSLPFYASIIIGLGLIILLFRYFWRIMIIGSSRMLERDLRRDFYHRLMSLGSRFYHQTDTGDIMARATNDVKAVQQAAGFGVVIAADIIFMGFVALAMMLYISRTLTLYALTVGPFIAISTYYFGKIIHIKFERSQEGFSLLSSKVREFITGIRIIKNYVQEEEAVLDFDKVNEDYLGRSMDLIKYWAGFWPVIFFLAEITFSIILFFGGRDVISGRITLGSFVAFFYYLDIMIWPMIAIGLVINMTQRGTASLKRLNRVLKLEPEIKDTGKEKVEKGVIELKDIYFSYNGTTVLKGITIRFEPNKRTAIVGTTAAGRTTIINLLWRYYETEGIYIDGKPIQDISLENLRRSIGLVPQSTILFSTSIKDNISFGNPRASEEEIIRVAKKAEIYEEIMELENGFDTHLGERGTNLSGGQRQRIAIARALILDPPILILDDALSSVDSHTEKAIMENISDFLKRRTSIIISHRLSAIKTADEILVMENGEITERGTHEELIRNGKLYTRLYEKQKLEELLE
ncbi:ABC transporter ATP-binding protein, partial [candidate division WOR-3 bacterium]|nr:ABC transporter ATP-binding protein [candidate division WOR-3 bacterium]